MNYNVAIVGPPGVITGFAALGVEPFPAATSEEAQAVITKLVRATNDEHAERKYAVVIVVEDLLRALSEKDYAALTKHVLPSIVAIPGVEGSQGYMREKLREHTIRAIGSDIV